MVPRFTEEVKVFFDLMDGEEWVGKQEDEENEEEEEEDVLYNSFTLSSGVRSVIPIFSKLGRVGSEKQ